MSEEIVETFSIPPVKDWTLTDLKYACKNNNVKGYSKMNKGQLVEVVEGLFAQMEADKNGTE